jgi:polysaccharide biosynthesis protein PslH
MARILFLSQLLPYPTNAGAKVRSYYVLRRLAQKNQVTLLAFSRHDDSSEAVEHLREICNEVHLVMMHRNQFRNMLFMATSLLQGKSFIIQRDYVPEMSKTIEWLFRNNQFDAIHTDQLWMAQYALQAKQFAPDALLLLDEHNACFQIWQRLAVGERNPIKRLLLEREWRKLQTYEAYACSHFDHVVTVTEDDQNNLSCLVLDQKKKSGRPASSIKKDKFSTIPICVDTQSIVPVQPTMGTSNVLHLGTMFWAPNVEGVLWFARQVWPIVAAKIPKATFTIAGKDPPAEIRELSYINNGRSSIQVTGYVPDPQPFLERAGVFVVPLLSGGGMRVKIIDAWRWGLPIVSTSIGAEGINIQPGKNIMIADDPEAFALAILKILRQPNFAAQLRINGRHWVEENYDWRTVYSKWDSIYDTHANNQVRS